jgi:hypothetical protein
LVRFLHLLHEILEDGHGVLEQLVVHDRYLVVEVVDFFLEFALLELE